MMAKRLNQRFFCALSLCTFLLSLAGCGNDQSAAGDHDAHGGNDAQHSVNIDTPVQQHISEKEFLVSDIDAYNERASKIRPGETIVLANGVWEDFEIVFTGEGNADSPITLRAEEKGKVFISGQSNLRMSGEHLIVSGLVFKNGHTPTSEVIAYRTSKTEFANYSRVTEVVIDNYSNPERTETDYWVSMYGKHNRFDHNHLQGKSNNGVTMAVRLDSEESRENHHRIDHNYFGPRSVLGSNGGETLRVGTSHFSLFDSFTVVENNYFDRCDGELEIISNKSGKNQFRGNVFFESRGTLTMRHGNGNLVENNVFFGNGVDHTGGIRVINADQTIRNNYMEGLAGYRFGGALVVMNGVPNSPINRYHQVDNALIENNSLINSDHVQLAAGSDEERSAIPSNSVFSANLIYNEDGRDTFTIYDDISGIRFENNVLNDVDGFPVSSGFASHSVSMSRADNGLLYPVDQAYDELGVSRDLQPISKEDTGVNWYPKTSGLAAFDSGQTIKLSAGDDIAAAVIEAQPGDRIELAAGEYLVSKVLHVNKPLTISAGVPVGDIATNKPGVHIAFERGALAEIQDGGALKIQGLSITGSSSPDSAGNTVIRTQRSSMLFNYQLIVEDSVISDLNINHSFTFFTVAKSTLADNVVIRNSHFKNITGSVLKLSAETDDYGIFNADYLTIEDSLFESVGGSLVDYYRGGTDESTFGPHFTLTGSTLKNVGRDKRNRSGGVMLLHGVQRTDITENEFIDSPGIVIRHTVGEPVTRIYNNRFVGTPTPSVVELNSIKENTAMIYDNVSVEDAN